MIGLGDRHSSNILLLGGSGEVVHIDLGIAFDQGALLPTPERVPFRLTRDLVHGCGGGGGGASSSSAVGGALGRCSEVALGVLRSPAGRDALLLLVEVLIHDPILKWAMSPTLARRKQWRGGSVGGGGGGGGGGATARGGATPSRAGGGGGGGGDEEMEEGEDDGGEGGGGGGEAVGAWGGATAAGAAAPEVLNADAERALLRVRRKLDGSEEGGDPRPVGAQARAAAQPAQAPAAAAAAAAVLGCTDWPAAAGWLAALAHSRAPFPANPPFLASFPRAGCPVAGRRAGPGQPVPHVPGLGRVGVRGVGVGVGGRNEGNRSLPGVGWGRGVGLGTRTLARRRLCTHTLTAAPPPVRQPATLARQPRRGRLPSSHPWLRAHPGTPGPASHAASSAVDARPLAALRWGKRPKRATTSQWLRANPESLK